MPIMGICIERAVFVPTLEIHSAVHQQLTFVKNSKSTMCNSVYGGTGSIQVDAKGWV
jgi:hypothetical protein